MAQSLVRGVLNSLDLTGGFIIVEAKAPGWLAGRSLQSAGLRSTYKVNLVTVKKAAQPEASVQGNESPEASVQGNESPKAQAADESPADYWIQYPYARREAGKELVFLARSRRWGGGGGAGREARRAHDLGRRADADGAAHTVPLWLNVLAGVLLGYLIGGGVVWLVRIAGTLAFNKDAMGLGDVHIMAAVGAVMGWLDATLAFFLAAFVGLAVEIVSRLAAASRGCGGRSRTGLRSPSPRCWCCSLNP